MSILLSTEVEKFVDENVPENQHEIKLVTEDKKKNIKGNQERK
jgi:hypothetical protein